MGRDFLYRALLARITVALLIWIGLTALGLAPLVAFGLGYGAVALYQWIMLGRIPPPCPPAWPRLTLSALWPVAYLYAAS